MAGNAVWSIPEIDVAFEDRKAPGRMYEDIVDEILYAERARTKTREWQRSVRREASCSLRFVEV